MHAKWCHTGVSQVETILQKNTMYTTGGEKIIRVDWKQSTTQLWYTLLLLFWAKLFHIFKQFIFKHFQSREKCPCGCYRLSQSSAVSLIAVATWHKMVHQPPIPYFYHHLSLKLQIIISVQFLMHVVSKWDSECLTLNKFLPNSLSWWRFL